MMNVAFALLLLPQDPAAIVQRGVDAMGGAEALRSARTVAADYYTTAWSLGQSETWQSPPRASVAYGRWINDWQGERRVISQESRNTAGQLARIRRVTAGGIGFFETGVERPVQQVDNPATVANVQRLMRREFDRVLLAALQHPGALSALRVRPWRGETQDGVRAALPDDTVHLWFERRSGLLSAIERVTDDPILGDRVTTTYLTRWHPAGNLRWPRQWDVMVNGDQAEHTILTSVTINGSVPDSLFAIPDSLASRAQRGPAPAAAPVRVTMTQLAAGVWRAEGGSHHTLVVEQGRQLVLAEAPQSTARFGAVLDTLRARFPGRRMAVVVNTHHHWDHAGGLRAAIGAGLPIATHELNEGFIRRIAATRKTLAPDEQSRRQRRPTIQPVRDSMVIGAGEQRVVVYPMATIHADDVLGIWVPSARVLFTSDVVNPVANQPIPSVGARELVAFARQYGLSPDRYAGGHGPVVAWSEIQAAGER